MQHHWEIHGAVFWSSPRSDLIDFHCRARERGARSYIRCLHACACPHVFVPKLDVQDKTQDGKPSVDASMHTTVLVAKVC